MRDQIKIQPRRLMLRQFVRRQICQEKDKWPTVNGNKISFKDGFDFTRMDIETYCSAEQEWVLSVEADQWWGDSEGDGSSKGDCTFYYSFNNPWV